LKVLNEKLSAAIDFNNATKFKSYEFAIITIALKCSEYA
jgi:hypothetical protein